MRNMVMLLLVVLLAQLPGAKCFPSTTRTAIPTSKLPKVSLMLAKIEMPIKSAGEAQTAFNQVPFFSERTLIEHGAMGTKKVMVWNEATSSFKYHSESKFNLQRALHGHFFPSGELTPDYYRYATWRATQRLVSATNGVFGTQALLMALGFNKKRIGVAAATAWVLKDCLGKISRIFWASVNGRKFDGDAKKWRFRASLLFVLGNALEIVTYVFPAFFLVTAALANAMKQMAMVTSSATRNAIYKSFSRNNDNIGDITAKGEAQIAVIDLLGLLIGIKISKLTKLSKTKIVSVFVLLSMVDLYCVYNEIRSVVFHVLNFERSGCVLPRAFRILEAQQQDQQYQQDQQTDFAAGNVSTSNAVPLVAATGSAADSEIASANDEGSAEVYAYTDLETDQAILMDPYASLLYTSPTVPSQTTPAAAGTASVSYDVKVDADATLVSDTIPAVSTVVDCITGTSSRSAQCTTLLQQLSPAYVAKHEQLLLPSLYGEGMIQTWSTLSHNDAASLQQYVQYSVEQREHVVVVLSARLVHSWLDAYLVKIGARRGNMRLIGGYPVVITTELLVHNNATSMDIFRALVQVNSITYEMSKESSGATMEQVTAALRRVPVSCIRSARARSRASQRNLLQDAVQRAGQLVDNILHGDRLAAAETVALQTTPITIAAPAATAPAIVATSNSSDTAVTRKLGADEVLLEQIGLGPSALLTRVQGAHQYEKRNLGDITALLSKAGWVADRFMFGAINRRVEW